MKRILMCAAAMLLTAVAAGAQRLNVGTLTPPATDVQNMYAAGVSYSVNATPAIAGTALYAHEVTDSGLYAFTAVDALPNTIRPLTVTSNIGVGVAQKVATLGKVPIYMPTAAGVSWSNSPSVSGSIAAPSTDAARSSVSAAGPVCLTRACTALRSDSGIPASPPARAWSTCTTKNV